MVQWMHELQALLEAEFYKRPMLASLATVSLHGKPRMRMMVIRHVDERDLSIWMITDSRSGKAADLKHEPAAELLVWSQSERQQFRLRGTVKMHGDGPARLALWQQLNNATRAQFFWPTPCTIGDSGDGFAASISADTPVPENFVALALHPEEVESLELNEH